MNEYSAMQKYIAALSLSALMAGFAPHALAASSTDLTVAGSITPNACIPSLSGNGKVDYETILAKDLNQDTSTLLESRAMTVTVNCDALTRLALLGIDNRAGSSDLNSTYGLGKSNNAQNIGQYFLFMLSAIADGADVLPIKSRDGETGWHGHLTWMPGDYVSVADRADPGQPLFFKDLSLELSVDTAIVAAKELDLTSEITLDGLATMEMKYL